MVSRWERGVTVPGPYYRERLCAVLGKTAEELGLIRSGKDPLTPSSSFVFLTSSHTDAEKLIVSNLKTVFQEREIALWSHRQLSRQGSEYGRTALREVVQDAQVILVLVSPEARSSRHVRETLELARRYQRPVCGVWIEGEHWQECLPEGSGGLAALIDARGRNDADLLEELVRVLERVVVSPHDIEMLAKSKPEAQALIQVARRGFAQPLCTDHGSAMHPGYQPDAPCPEFNPAAANKLLDDNGWVKGPDGVRIKGGKRLEFEYSTVTGYPWLSDTEAIVQRNLGAIGIRLDIQNYPANTFFNSFLPGGKASPPTGAVAGRYDIGQFWNTFGYDPDDAYLLACNQIPPSGYNIDFYCNPALDALYRQEQTIADPGMRQQIFEQIHAIYLTEFPFITLYSPFDIGMVRGGTHNHQPGPTGALETINIWQWWCDKGKC